MKIKKITVAAILAVATVMGSTAMPASAVEISHTSSGQSFNDDWELYDSGDNYSMTYGFNTAFIDEDYCWTRCNSTSHTAIVKNNNGQFSNNAKKGKTAKIEVSHTGTLVTYKMVY